jgi:hypothetical protein
VEKIPQGAFVLGFQKTSNAQHPMSDAQSPSFRHGSACHAEAAKAGEPSMCSEFLLV